MGKTTIKQKKITISESIAEREYRKLIEKEIHSIEKQNKENLKKAQEEYLCK